MNVDLTLYLRANSCPNQQEYPMKIMPLMSVREAADLLSISERKMYQLVSEGSVKAIKIGGSTRIARDEVERIAREGTR